MPRRKTASLQRNITPDRKYDSVLVARLINKVMLDGKKQLAERQVYEAMELAAKKLKSEDQLATLEASLKKIYPQMEVRSRRVGGANYQIPYEVSGSRQIHLGLTWFVTASRDRRKGMGKSFAEAMAAEIVDASNDTGNAVKKREDTHRMAEANRAFAHFARF